MPAELNHSTDAYIERFEVPPSAHGALCDLSFAVKDLIDVAGHTTGCGNPSWHSAHSPAAFSAVCVEQLLAAGATCKGKTITDEMAFSLIGENYFYGTPLNPRAPDRVPGGSSSGSASAVACGSVDFALGTDTGGSVRVPASNCGIWGWRPTHGAVSVAGVMPLAPTYDTVGVLAKDSRILRLAATILAGLSSAQDATPARLLLPAELWAAADPAVRAATSSAAKQVGDLLDLPLEDFSLAECCNDSQAARLTTWHWLYRELMASEVGSTLGTWVANNRPELGPMAAAGIQLVMTLDRRVAQEAVRRRERYCELLFDSIDRRDLILMPTTPLLAPFKGSIGDKRGGDYYLQTLAFNALSGVGRLPQVSMPLADVDGVPIGLSLVGARGEDAFVLDVAKTIETQWTP